MGDEHFAAAEVLAAAADRLAAHLSVADALDTIVHTALDTVPAVDLASISTMRRTGQIETVAATGDLVLQVDETQYATGEGPCVDALRQQAPAIIGELDDARRWPAFVPLSRRLGVCGRMAFLLRSGPPESSALNLYSMQVDAFEEGSRRIGQLFATHARHALAKAQLAHDMDQALASRKEIGQAIGIVMERYGLDEDGAFAFLVRVSRDGNVKLRAVAKQVVVTANDAVNERARASS